MQGQATCPFSIKKTVAIESNDSFFVIIQTPTTDPTVRPQKTQTPQNFEYPKFIVDQIITHVHKYVI